MTPAARHLIALLPGRRADVVAIEVQVAADLRDRLTKQVGGLPPSASGIYTATGFGRLKGEPWVLVDRQSVLELIEELRP